jgi:hypothetical protein
MRNRDFNIDTQILKRKVGLSAIYFALNKQHNRTFFGEDDNDFKPAVRECLHNLWDVPEQSSFKRFMASKNYKPMVETLNWLKHTGHRSSELYNDNRYYRSALAWDVARYSDNIRHAYYLNYINKKTALEHLDCAYDMSKDQFESWEDYGRNFLFFKSIWDNDKLIDIVNRTYSSSEKQYSADELKKIQIDVYRQKGISLSSELTEVVNSLISDRDSIWNSVPWNI